VRTRAVVGLAAWACAALGCAAAIGPSIAHDERETFRASSFDFARLKGGGLAMLGVTSRVAPEGIRDDAAFVIDQAVANRFSRVTLVSRNDTVARARQAGMAADLQRLIKGYEERGAFDAGLLRRIAALEVVRYFLIAAIMEYERITRDVATAPSLVVMPGLPRARRGAERVERIRLRGEVWDSRCGIAVWTGEGGTEVIQDPAAEDVPLHDVVSMAATNLISVLPRPGEGREAGEKECGT